MSGKKKKISKKSLIEIKNLTEKDWRGILAVIILCGGLLISALSIILNSPESIAAISTLMYAVAEWYFKSREQG